MPFLLLGSDFPPFLSLPLSSPLRPPSYFPAFSPGHICHYCVQVFQSSQFNTPPFYYRTAICYWKAPSFRFLWIIPMSFVLPLSHAHIRSLNTSTSTKIFLPSTYVRCAEIVGGLASFTLHNMLTHRTCDSRKATPWDHRWSRPADPDSGPLVFVPLLSRTCFDFPNFQNCCVMP